MGYPRPSGSSDAITAESDALKHLLNSHEWLRGIITDTQIVGSVLREPDTASERQLSLDRQNHLRQITSDRTRIALVGEFRLDSELQARTRPKHVIFGKLSRR